MYYLIFSMITAAAALIASADAASLEAENRKLKRQLDRMKGRKTA